MSAGGNQENVNPLNQFKDGTEREEALEHSFQPFLSSEGRAVAFTCHELCFLCSDVNIRFMVAQQSRASSTFSRGKAVGEYDQFSITRNHKKMP
jgi:hypothetical protein